MKDTAMKRDRAGTTPYCPLQRPYLGRTVDDLYQPVNQMFVQATPQFSTGTRWLSGTATRLCSDGFHLFQRAGNVTQRIAAKAGIDLVQGPIMVLGIDCL